jgi:hypothetical protein
MDTRTHEPDVRDAEDPQPLMVLDHGGFWIGSRDCGPAYVRVTPFGELSGPTLRALGEWAR